MSVSPRGTGRSGDVRVTGLVAATLGIGAAVDPDRDGLDARCELALARAFAPVLVVRSGGCGWDDQASPARPGGGYAFAVQRGRDGGFVRIAYLPAYYRDCGWTGAKCWLPPVGCSPHAGDSEAIIVEVEYEDATDRWRTRGVFPSSHCFGRGAGACRWYQREALAAFEWTGERPRGAPVVWAAAGRQANYPSSAACDRGGVGGGPSPDSAGRHRMLLVAEPAVPRLAGCWRGDEGDRSHGLPPLSRRGRGVLSAVTSDGLTARSMGEPKRSGSRGDDE